MEQKEEIKPVGSSPKGWALKKGFIDEIGNVFNRGVFSHSLTPEEIAEHKEQLEEEKESTDMTDSKPEAKTPVFAEKIAGIVKPKPNKKGSVEQLKVESDEVDEMIEHYEKLINKHKRLAELKEKAKAVEEADDKLRGVIKRNGFKFYPEELEYFKQFNSDTANNIFYLCYLEEDCPAAYMVVAGQSFEHFVVTRKDGHCPKCSEGYKGRTRKGKVKRRPKYAGELNPSCPECGTSLEFDSADYKEIEMRQRYPGISGDQIFCVAMLAHKKEVVTPQYDLKAKKDLPPIKVKAIEYVKMEWVKVNNSGNIIMSRQVDMRGIYNHYEKTVKRDKSGTIQDEGEKKIFFLAEQKYDEQRAVFPDFEESEV
jgi:hypothetical protein